jgi:hypothetical protein
MKITLKNIIHQTKLTYKTFEDALQKDGVYYIFATNTGDCPNERLIVLNNQAFHYDITNNKFCNGGYLNHRIFQFIRSTESIEIIL